MENENYWQSEERLEHDEAFDCARDAELDALADLHDND